MRLVDLMPRWIHPNVFTFLCPHCRQIFLTCKNIVMPTWEQREIFWREVLGWDGRDSTEPHHKVEYVGCKPEMAWNFESGAAFKTMTVTPSLDASASGHWHGHLTAGEIVGGIPA